MLADRGQESASNGQEELVRKSPIQVSGQRCKVEYSRVDKGKIRQWNLNNKKRGSKLAKILAFRHPRSFGALNTYLKGFTNRCQRLVNPSRSWFANRDCAMWSIGNRNSATEVTHVTWTRSYFARVTFIRQIFKFYCVVLETIQKIDSVRLLLLLLRKKS